ncbi:hypothetical protein BD289DRAFT_458718 [Coniella lustricola]|uniref:C2 domain-containing protein n=1 Tax=Coniella lustricola TaxID=2025994 RepID=A0A2T3AHS6_9PEZI|nr:hypothetical protein BD289DRAFT_458718 [Coniella lustricola]
MGKAHLVNGPHSAGIFADMSIDGPVIGTLVLIVDRAKNLPNRKTIGKQDPYCAARLGKEAKKTTTDVRGGQTPRWDQELRFTVHDGPDYFQLKLSVFNDDKKTELIGEAWIDLRDIIIPGGGQNDLWQGLTCRGKYAGDVRIEITFYDSRPKPEKPVAKPKPVNAEPDALPAQQKIPKRRPLPSDPFTGQAPTQPSPPLQQQPAQSYAPNGVRSQPSLPRDYAPDTQLGSYGTTHQRHADSYSSASGSIHQSHSSRTDGRRQSVDMGFPVYPEDLEYPPSHQGIVMDTRFASPAPYGAPSSESAYGMEPEDDRPPPPPAHRIAPGSTPAPIMRKDVLRNEAHRQSIPSSNAYPGRPVYRAHESSPAAVPAGNDPYTGMNHPASPPRHQSYDAHYDHHHRSLQPTVEDVPDSPSSGLDDYKRITLRSSPLAQADYRHDASPPPLNLSGRNSAPAAHYQQPYHQDPTPDYSRNNEVSYAAPNHSSGPGNEPELLETQMRAPATTVPTALIPGVDPALSMEIAQKINEGGRHDRRHNPSISHMPRGSSRGRQMLAELPPSYDAPSDLSLHAQMPPYNSEAYEHNGSIYSRASSQHAMVRREMSPSRSPGGRNTIRRKSVSPAPPAENHRLSGVPFGPDSYNALNPALAVGAPKELESRASREYDEIDGVIITHDGREVDPSDHLPMDTWAPEPEPKAGKPSTTATVSFKSPSSGPHSPIPPPTSGRKALRIRERPVSAIPPSTYGTPDAAGGMSASMGRNRLQKKTNRSSAMPVMMSGANGLGYGSLAPSPLAPLPHQHDRDLYVSGALPVRASTVDYEHHAPAPMYDMQHMAMVGRDHSSSAPPLPAKIPIASSNALVPMRYGGDEGGDVALMEEMSRIDIGSGRARRHAQRPTIGGY